MLQHSYNTRQEARNTWRLRAVALMSAWMAPTCIPSYCSSLYSACAAERANRLVPAHQPKRPVLPLGDAERQ
eukprot:2306145-Pyramimonas_sp.AAC.1